VHEEAGLSGVYSFADDPRGNSIPIVYRCRVAGGEAGESAEGTSPAFFSPGEIPAGLAGGGHDQAIRAWAESRAS